MDKKPTTPVLQWLLKGDVSIQFQAKRDLFDKEVKNLQFRIDKEGWGAAFLSKRNKNGHWGRKFYQPKWTSTHYTLLDLKNLCIRPDVPEIQSTLAMVFNECKSPDGSILPIGKEKISDVCVNGMFLNYASYFNAKEVDLKSVIDFIIDQHMSDGGFNCESNRRKPVHSSLHTTLSVLEGFAEYRRNEYAYRSNEIRLLETRAREFILMHQFFLSDRTGDIINKNFLRFVYPPRWRYDILRCLDYFQSINHTWDERMRAAIDTLIRKRHKDGT